MAVPKAKRKRKDKRVVMTRAKWREVKAEALGQCFILVGAYMMEEMEKPAEEICALWDGVARYSEAIDKKLITLNKVCKILSDYTEMDIHWNGAER